jgi:hypothetical protein
MIPDATVLTPSAQPGGLLSVARSFPDDLDWTRGVIFTSGECLSPDRVGPCPVPSGSPGDDPYQSLEPATFLPIQLRLAVACTTRARAGLGAFASQSMVITREAALGAELQDGLASESNPKLEDATVSFGTTSVVDAISCLEAHAASILMGRQIWLHLPPAVGAHLMPGDLWRDGNLWRTTFGSILVLSPGYVGSRIFATGDVFAAASQDPPLEAVDRSINRQEAWGDAAGLVAFDPCFLAAAETGIVPCEQTSP